MNIEKNGRHWCSTDCECQTTAPKEQKCPECQFEGDHSQACSKFVEDEDEPPQTGIGEEELRKRIASKIVLPLIVGVGEHAEFFTGFGVISGEQAHGHKVLKTALDGIMSLILQAREETEEKGRELLAKCVAHEEEMGEMKAKAAREEGRREYQDVVEAEVAKAHELGVEEGANNMLNVMSASFDGASHQKGYEAGYLQAIEDMEAVVERGEFRVVSYEAVDVEKSGTYYRKEDVTAHLQALKEKKPTNPT